LAVRKGRRGKEGSKKLTYPKSPERAKYISIGCKPYEF